MNNPRAWITQLLETLAERHYDLGIYLDGEAGDLFLYDERGDAGSHTLEAVDWDRLPEETANEIADKLDAKRTARRAPRASEPAGDPGEPIHERAPLLGYAAGYVASESPAPSVANKKAGGA